MEETRRQQRRVRALVCVAIGGWLLYLSRWVVTNSLSGERDSNPFVYVIYGAFLWLPGILLLGWGLVTLRGKKKEPRR